MKPWVTRASVVLTALLCLAVAGYAGQVWWARRIAKDTLEAWRPYLASGRFFPMGVIPDWKATPWYGRFNDSIPSMNERAVPSGLARIWVPPLANREFLVGCAGVDLGDDPSAWEAWFQAHPNLVWDANLNRLVDKP